MKNEALGSLLLCQREVCGYRNDCAFWSIMSHTISLPRRSTGGHTASSFDMRTVQVSKASQFDDLKHSIGNSC